MYGKQKNKKYNTGSGENRILTFLTVYWKEFDSPPPPRYIL